MPSVATRISAFPLFPSQPIYPHAMTAEPTPTGAPLTAPETPETAPARAAAISELFRDHNRALVNFLLTRLPDEQEAREVAQEAYVKLLQLDQPVATSILRWTLFKIARCIAIDRQRQRISRTRIDRLGMDDGLDLSDPTENRIIAAEELGRLLEALRELPEKTQHAFLLQRYRGLTPPQVAARLGITDRMVRHHVSRALSYCRYRLDGLSREEALQRTKE
jgi:RNA polymerase sigma factor (sigma-70 family)